MSDKMNNNKKGQSLIHKTESLLDNDVIYDNFDCPLFVARGWNFNVPTLRSLIQTQIRKIHLRPPGKVLTMNLGQHKLETI